MRVLSHYQTDTGRESGKILENGRSVAVAKSNKEVTDRAKNGTDPSDGSFAIIQTMQHSLSLSISKEDEIPNGNSDSVVDRFIAVMG